MLNAAGEGDRASAARLMPLIYDDLRALAGKFFANQPPGHTLEATAVVNEAYLKLAQAEAVTWQGRSHFFAVAAKAIRQVITDYARRRKTEKRGGSFARITLSGLAGPEKADGIDLVALDDALTRLAALDARQAEVVELRFLAGLSVEETAHIMDIATRTVEREWLVAKAWLRRELSGES